MSVAVAVAGLASLVCFAGCVVDGGAWEEVGEVGSEEADRPGRADHPLELAATKRLGSAITASAFLLPVACAEL